MATSSTSPNVGLATQVGDVFSYPVAASTSINQNAAVCIDASGNANPAADTSGLGFVGIANLASNNASGAAAATNVTVTSYTALKRQEFNAVSPDKTWVRKRVFFVDDNTVALSAGSTNKILCGVVIQVQQIGTSGIVVVDCSQRAADASS